MKGMDLCLSGKITLSPIYWPGDGIITDRGQYGILSEKRIPSKLWWKGRNTIR
jgi:hypothetical protein